MNAPRDNNNIPSKLACLNTDLVQGQNLVPIAINQTNGALKVLQDGVISFTMQPVDPRDENYVGCWLFQGSDGLTYPAVANSDGYLIIDV